MSQSNPVPVNNGIIPADSSVNLQHKILLVEDSPVEMMRLQGILKKLGYDVITAADGRDAIEILLRQQIFIVISDWRMPNMNGLDLCREVRSRAEFNQPYFILITGFDSRNDLIAGMDAGADDFISKPFNSEELRVRVQAGVRIIQLRLQAEEKNSELQRVLAREEKINATLQQDLDAAAMMQRNLLPEDPHPLNTVEIRGLFQPAMTVAGDGYNYFPLDDQHLAFYHLDVSGHGASAAMLSFTVAHFLSPRSGFLQLRRDQQDDETADCIIEPDQVLAQLNRHFVEEDDCTRYFTMVYGVINTRTGAGQLCQAGHPHPLKVDRNGNLSQLGAGGLPVGLFADSCFENVEFNLAQGETLFLCSDGLTDATNPDGDNFGSQNLQQLLSRLHPQKLSLQLEIICKQIERWNGDKALDDDISVLAIQLNQTALQESR